MFDGRLTGSDKRALLLWVAVGIIGAIFAHKYYFRAFPEASVDFHVSRSEALARAQSFVGSLGTDVRDYRSSIIFDVDETAKTYLERELGLLQANQMMSSELNIWYWDVRFFRPQQEEEFSVRISTSGRVIGYSHKEAEALAGASLDRASAQSKAQTFLTSKLGVELNDWDFLPEQANSNKRPNRTDWSFTWEKHGFRAKDAPYRMEVSLQGDQPGGVEQYLQVPEAWQRDFKRLRSGNDTLTLVFTIPYLLVIVAAVWLGIRLTKRGETSWRGAIILGVVVTTVLFLQNLNDWPHWSADYSTNDSYGSFIVGKIAMALLLSILSALTVTLVLPAAEPLYRASQPNNLRLSKILTLRGLRSKEFFSAAVVGLSMAAAQIGYLVAFYIIARHFGAWAPSDLNYQESVNTAFPWISGAAIGLLAATNEEFTFRLFAIPFFKRLPGLRWVAVILPAFLWSFLHSNYPQEPAYIRGIEIGLVGIVAGMVMLRWGILATLIWHYTVDASLVGLFLVRSNSLYFKVSGVVVAAAAVAPLAFAAISYFSRGRFEPDEDLLNNAGPAPNLAFEKTADAAQSVDRSRRYEALKPATIVFLAICLIAGSALAMRVKPASIGSYLKLSIDARQAEATADKILRERGVDTNSFRRAAVLVNTTDAITNEFLRERVGVAGVNEIYAQHVPGALWRVRYFRDGQPEEYGVILRPDGSFYSLHHVLAEGTPGDSLSKDEAVARAEKFLSEEKKIDLRQWTLVEATSEKRPHRTDHVLTWQENDALDSATAGAAAVTNGSSTDHAYVRIGVGVLGDEVTDFHRSIKIPDEWKRKNTEVTLPRVVLAYALPALLFLGVGITVVTLYFKNLRSEDARSMPWKRFLLWSAWALVGYLLVFGFGNRWAQLLNSYMTSNPLKYTLAALGIEVSLGALFYVGADCLLFGIGWYFARQAFGEERLTGWSGMPRAYYRDALWIALGGTAAFAGLNALLETALQHWPTLHRASEATFGANFDAVVPAAAIFGSSLLGGLLRTGLIVLLAAFVAGRLGKSWQRALLFVVAAVAFAGLTGDWGGPADFAKQLVAQTVWLAIVVIGVRWIMRFNLMGCFLVLACTSLVDAAGELLSQPNHFYRANGFALVAALLVLLVWPAVCWSLRSGQPEARA